MSGLDLRRRLAGSKQYPGLDTFKLSDDLLMLHHVALVPGEAFGAPGFLRLSYATDEATIEEGLGKMAKALAAVV